ncbi:MAG: hypothetical protein ACRDGQ_02670 [Candidatus Limnocylindrales bacterium]
MAVNFTHVPHPRIAEHKKEKPPKTTDGRSSFNDRFALLITTVVGTMWCAYAFGVLALVALPAAIKSGDPLQIIEWVSQTFIQLVLLSIIMVGQNIMATASDKRADMTYKDADATFHEAEQIQAHLKAQDDALNAIVDKMAQLEASMAKG